MSKWAEEERDWIQLMIRHPPRKEAVIAALMKMLRQPAAHQEKKPGGISSKEPRDLDPMVLEHPTNTNGMKLTIKGDSKTVVDWINGHAKQKRQPTLWRLPRNN